MVEIGIRVSERPLAELQEAVDVPVLQQVFRRIDINREIDEIRDEYVMRVVRIVHPALQHVQTFQNQDVRLDHGFIPTRDAIVDQVRIDWRSHVRHAGFQVRDKFHQTVHIIRKRETFLLHQPTFF